MGRKLTMNKLGIGRKLHEYREFDLREAQGYLIRELTPQYDVCKSFGCGKHLHSQEILCGGYCIDHQKRETTLSVIDKYFAK